MIGQAPLGEELDRERGGTKDWRDFIRDSFPLCFNRSLCRQHLCADPNCGDDRRRPRTSLRNRIRGFRIFGRMLRLAYDLQACAKRGSLISQMTGLFRKLN